MLFYKNTGLLFFFFVFFISNSFLSANSDSIFTNKNKSNIAPFLQKENDRITVKKHNNISPDNLKSENNYIIPLSKIIGGSDDDLIGAVVFDENYIYIAGSTKSVNFPITKTPIVNKHQGGSDIFILKLDKQFNLIASILIGGNDDDECMGMVLDKNNNICLTGYTKSNNFPTTSGAFDRILNDASNSLEKGDVFILKIDNGLDNLLFSTYIGGSRKETGEDIAVDSQNNIIITGSTYSSDYPSTQNAYNPQKNEQSIYPIDAFITKINSTGNVLLYSTFLGGERDDYSKSIAIDKSDKVYISGYTSSSDFPITIDAYSDSHAGSVNTEDGFISKFDLNISGAGGLLYSTYVGGSGNDEIKKMTIDDYNDLNIIGETESSDFPFSSTAYRKNITGGKDIFILKFTPKSNGTNGNNDLKYSTYFGGSGDDFGSRIILDNENNIIITGYTLSSDFPVSRGPFMKNYNGNGDAFLVKFNYDLSGLLYSTYIGGSNPDAGASLTLFNRTDVVLSGTTASGEFPYDSIIGNRGLNDIYILKSNLNNTPDAPSLPLGPSKGFPNVDYLYTSATTDFENDQLFYLFDWGDGANSGWLGPYVSGVSINKSHRWSTRGVYYLKVKSKDINNNESEYSQSLIVRINTPPNTPQPVSPKNDSIGVKVKPTLIWDCSDYDGDTLTYSVYLDGQNPPKKLAAKQQGKSFSSPIKLNHNTTYYWRITAKDWIDSAEGNVWKFTTGANQAPDIPQKPDGIIKGLPDTEHMFSTKTIDPDEDQLFYQFDWGDNTLSEWLGPFSNDVNISGSHKWMKSGIYNIKVRAKDNFNNISSFSESTAIKINTPPDLPKAISPIDGANNIKFDAKLTWSCSDSDGDVLSYKFQVCVEDICIRTVLNDTIYSNWPKEYNRKYSWQIVSMDWADTTYGPIWKFYTEGTSLKIDKNIIDYLNVDQSNNYVDSIITLKNPYKVPNYIQKFEFKKVPSYFSVLSNGVKIENNQLPLIIPKDSEIVLGIRFSPNYLGEYLDTLEISNSSDNNPKIAISLKAKVILQKLSFNPGIMDYGRIIIGKSTDTTILINNTGTEKLIINDILISGKDKSQFILVSNGITFPGVINPGEQVTSSVKFIPSSAGRKVSFLELHTTEIGKIYYKLSGMGIDQFPGIDEENKSEYLTMNIFPNPFNQFINLNIEAYIKNDNEIVKLQIFDLSGRKILEKFTSISMGSNNFLFDFGKEFRGGLNSGFYIFNLNYKDLKLSKKALYIK